MNGELVSRPTVRQICRHRDNAVALYRAAHDSLMAASNALVDAGKELNIVSPSGPNRYNHHLVDGRGNRIDKPIFIANLAVSDEADFMREAKRFIDTNTWAHIVELTDIERLMDKKAKDEFYQQLVKNPPEVTEENVYATLQGLALQADTIFARGIANTFSALDRRFKSHDGFKIGGRVVLSGAFDEWGHWNYHRNHRDTLQDIERTFFILDGKVPPPNYAGVVGVIDDDRRRWGIRGARRSEVQSDFFTVRIFKNGNMHIWFKRDDLLVKVNRLLAEYYGEVIGDGQTKEDDGFDNIKTTPAKHFGFFPTPDDAAERLVDAANLWTSDAVRLHVLEPSAGTGNLARRCRDKGAVVDCIEIQDDLAVDLRASRLYREVVRADFLTIAPVAAYDRVVMNPPFDRERDIDHVMHAFKFLKPGGRLVAIMSAGTLFRETKKATSFRAVMEKFGAQWQDLPTGSFSSVGTNVNTVLLSVRQSVSF